MAKVGLKRKKWDWKGESGKSGYGVWIFIIEFEFLLPQQNMPQIARNWKYVWSRSQRQWSFLLLLSVTIRFFFCLVTDNRCIIGYWILLTVCYRLKWRMFLHIYIYFTFCSLLVLPQSQSLLFETEFTVPFWLIRPVTCHRAFGPALILVYVTGHIDFGRMWQMVQKKNYSCTGL